MTSEAGAATPQQLYVWAWLPGESAPVVVGAVSRAGGRFQEQEVLTFTYARSFRSRPDAISLFTPELPLRSGTFDPTDPAQSDVGENPGSSSLRLQSRRRSPLPLHGCLRDAAPDAWGRRVVNLRLAGDPDIELSELTYLLASSSDRIGALDFQASATDFVARGTAASLEQLLNMAELVENGQPLPADLAAAAGHGTSIGGARPKALLEDSGRHLIAKFPSTTDTRPVVKAEAAAMLLAARVGIAVAPVEVCDVAGRSVLLVERFDRGTNGTRRQLLSALTILGYAEMESRYASYAEFAEAVRAGPWIQPGATLTELFTRLVFNICVGNNDDHLRNHSAFWDGRHLQLTPAYDLTPSPRSTQVSSQAIGITRDGRRDSQLRLCREVSADFLLAPESAEEIIQRVPETIRAAWPEVCDQARLTKAEGDTLWGREILNPYIFFDEP
jgi:serine/threonine-protein kinase HipA